MSQTVTIHGVSYTIDTFPAGMGYAAHIERHGDSPLGACSKRRYLTEKDAIDDIIGHIQQTNTLTGIINA